MQERGVIELKRMTRKGERVERTVGGRYGLKIEKAEDKEDGVCVVQMRVT